MNLGGLQKALTFVWNQELPVFFGGDIQKFYTQAFEIEVPLLVPGGFSSYRAFYDRVALEPLQWSPKGSAVPPPKVMNVRDWTDDVIGQELIGPKGGRHLMQRDTPVYAAKFGDSTNIGIFDVVENEMMVILVTYSVDDY